MKNKPYYLRPAGAALYYAGIDKETSKPSVFMETPEGDVSVIDTALTMELAIKKANRWQEKENAAVIKASYKNKIK